MNKLVETNAEKANQPIRVLAGNLPEMLGGFLADAFSKVEDIRLVSLSRPGTPPPTHTIQADVALVGTTEMNDPSTALDFLEILWDDHPNLSTIVLTQRPGYEEAISLFQRGVRGIFCVQDLNFSLLCKSIRCVHQGQIWASNDVMSHLVDAVRHRTRAEVTDLQGNPILTPREQQVLNLLADGLTNQAMAKDLSISRHTVKNHVFNIFEKLGVSNRTEAVLYAVSRRPASHKTVQHSRVTFRTPMR
jgi:DNA-binding NarL/FixJ family response regulator